MKNISLWEDEMGDEPIIGNEVVNLRRIDSEIEQIIDDNKIVPSFE